MNIFKRLFWKLAAPVRWRLEQLEEAQEYLRNRQIVLDSPFWDENYYFCHYSKDIIQSELYPLDHYLQIGWKLGYNPSAFFDARVFCQRYKHECNPLVYYLIKGRFQGYGLPNNPYPHSEQAIENYWNIRSQRTSKSVFYTCITNGYDNINQIRSYSYIDPDWDYICFTDDSDLISQKRFGIWEIRPLQFTELDDARNNRYHKILPHVIFPEYQQSVYLDGNVSVRTSYLFDQIKALNQPLIQPIQCCGYCLYKDIDWAMTRECDTEKLKEQLAIFRQDGFPEDYGLFENNLIYRRHNEPLIIDIMEQWWGWVRDYCRRDQSSLMYVLWKHGIKPDSSNTINNTRIDYNNFCSFWHAKSHVF